MSYPSPDIDSFCVGHRRQRVVDGGRLSWHGEQGRHTERDSGRNRVGVEPEAHPGDDDQHAAGNVNGQKVIRELALERQVHR